MKNDKQIFFYCFFAVPLLLIATPLLVLAKDATVRTKIGSLTCGDGTLTVQTTFFENKNQFTQILAQQVTLKNKRTNQQKELPIDGRYVIKHMPDEHKVLDAWIWAWSCIKATNKKYYFKVSYVCSYGEESGICKPTTVHVEWVRYLRDDGTMLYESPRHSTMKHAEESLYRHLGFFDPERVISWKDMVAGGND